MFLKKSWKKKYYSLVHPYVKYGFESWHGAFLSATEFTCLYQRSPFRAIFMLNFNAHRNDFFKKTYFRKSDELYKFNLSYISLRYSKIKITISSLNTLDPIQNSTLLTRDTVVLSIRRFNLTISLNSFVYQSLKDWNCLPSTMKNRSNVCMFIFNLKITYFRNMYK